MTPADADQIRAIIQQQLAAFGQDDAATAFSFASPSIQAQFGDAETFMQMVKSGYAPVYRPQGLLFGELTCLEGMPA